MPLPDIPAAVYYVAAAVSAVVAIGAIIVGATAGSCGGNLSVPLDAWSIVWGVVTTLALMLTGFETCMYVSPLGFNALKWLVLLFLFIPWQMVGLMLLLQTNTGCSSPLLFGWSVVAVSLTYVYLVGNIYALKVRSDDARTHALRADDASTRRFSTGAAPFRRE